MDRNRKFISMRENLTYLSTDLTVNRSNHKILLVMTLFRLSSYLYQYRFRQRWILFCSLPILAFYRFTVEWILGIELPFSTQVGPGLEIHHGQALVVNGNTIIGSHCLLRHCTTIGCVRLPDGRQGPSPVIGDRVEVGSNVVILGGITIGNNVKIGAGAVVLKSLPDNVVAVGNPARILEKK